MAIEELKEIGERLDLKYGDRYRGWYLIKEELRDEKLPLNYQDKDIYYNFKIADYNYRWVMPPKLEFSNGTIYYSEAERRLGVFRFPQKDGKFSAPIKFDQNDFMKMSKEEIEDLLENRKVLTFEAFRIPQFGFEFMDISDKDFEDIAGRTDRSFMREIKTHYLNELNTRISKVKDKIESVCNYLLILENVLNLQWKDLDEVSHATNNIIHL